jgi:hypothetical protein
VRALRYCILGVGLVAAAIACGGGGDTSDQAGSPTTVQTAVPQAVRDYFDALATNDPSDMAPALDEVADDSPAELYATHQIAFARIPGVAPFTTTADVVDDTIVLTSRGVEADGTTEFEDSTTFSDFTLVDDRLATFSVDENPIADRIRGGDPGGVSSNGVTVRIITAYQAHEGDLAVNVDITNVREAEIQTAVSEWTLDTADGRQLKPAEPSDFVLSSIQPGTTQPHFVTYEQAPLGGTLGVAASASDSETGLRFDVPVPSTTTTSESSRAADTSESPAITDAATDLLLEDLRVGDCFNDSGHGTPEVGEITRVDCQVPHDSEVFATPTVPGEPGAAYPGDDEIDRRSGDLCLSQFAPYVGIDFQDSTWEFDYFGPPEETWREYDDRLVICALTDPNFAKIEGSKRGSRT